MTVDHYEPPRQLNEDLKRSLKQYFQNKSDLNRNHSNSSGKVDKDMCELFQDMRDEGVEISDIASTFNIQSENTIYYHLGGRCSHTKRVRVTYDECGWMRVHAHRGAPSRTLSVLYNITQENASIHILGKCSHEDGIEPLEADELRANSYSEPDMETSVCPECKEEFEHKKYRDQRFCSNQCNAVYASKKSAGRV